MSTFVGRAAEPKHEPKPVPAAVQEPVGESVKAPKAERTRAELIEEAEALGIKVPKNANKAQIAKLIEDAPVM